MSQHSSNTKGANTVFQTYELLENIMLHLSSKEILVNRRVATHWHSVVQRSQDLQERLFFKACSEPINPVIEADVESPSHRTAYKDTFKFNDMASMGCGHNNCSKHSSFAFLGLSHSVGSHSWGTGQSIFRQHVKGESIGSTSPPQSYGAAPSWRRMLISQPPITAVRLSSKAILEPTGPFNLYEEAPFCTIWNPRGLTFGDLFNGWCTVHANAGLPDPEWKTSPLGICLPLPLADGALDQAVRQCGPVVTMIAGGYSTKSRSQNMECSCVQIWQGH